MAIPVRKETSIYLDTRAHKPMWLGDADEEKRHIKLLLKNKMLLKTISRPGGEVIEVFESKAYGQIILWAVAHDIEEEPSDGRLILETRVQVMLIKQAGEPDLKAPCQVSLWRNHDYPLTVGIPGELFWSRLFDKFDAVLSDSTQTSPGRAFWQHQVAEAFKRGLHVIGLDLWDTTGMNVFKVRKAVRLTRLSQLSAYYGGEDAGDTRLLIKKP